MKKISLEELLEAGCHFGHQLTRQNPKARDFVFESRDNINIINLDLTKQGLEEAMQYVYDLAKNNGNIVVVGSKRQAAPIVIAFANKVKEELKKKSIPDNLYVVTNRWIGGTLTNAGEVRKNYQKLHNLSANLKDDMQKAKYTKKEIGMWEKERTKLDMFYGGIAGLSVLPDALFIVDTHNEDSAVREAERMSITTVGIVDTNADPDPIDYVIPANDDAVGSLELIIGAVLDAWKEGREKSVKNNEEKLETNDKEKEIKKESVEAKPVENPDKVLTPVKSGLKIKDKEVAKKPASVKTSTVAKAMANKSAGKKEKITNK